MKKVLLWGCLFLMMGIIFLFSMQPGKKSTQTSEEVTEQIIKILPGTSDSEKGITEKIFKRINYYVRKSAHFICYMLLGILAMLAISTTKYSIAKKLVFALLICLFFAASDEIHQLFVPGRSGEIRDVCLDFAGSVVGTAITCGCLFLFKKYGRKNVKNNEEKQD